jgi:hypothetical protein
MVILQAGLAWAMAIPFVFGGALFICFPVVYFLSLKIATKRFIQNNNGIAITSKEKAMLRLFSALVSFGIIAVLLAVFMTVVMNKTT